MARLNFSTKSSKDTFESSPASTRTIGMICYPYEIYAQQPRTLIDAAHALHDQFWSTPSHGL
jgi:hypothetical protein